MLAIVIVNRLVDVTHASVSPPPDCKGQQLDSRKAWERGYVC